MTESSMNGRKHIKDLTPTGDRATQEIREALQRRLIIVAISGPSGSGKDYLTSKAVDYFESIGVRCHNIQMTTDRPSRGVVETKICISKEDYDRLQDEGLLLGDHVNNYRYGYSTQGLRDVIGQARSDGGIVVLELNPITQKEFPVQLHDALGEEVSVWVGVTTTLDQTRENMVERGESPAEIEKRLGIMTDFIDAMESNPAITLCDNGPQNRVGSGDDFIEIVKGAILQPAAV